MPMKINLLPQVKNGKLVLIKSGDILTINGDTLDMSVIPNGATFPNSEELHPFLTGDISRLDNGDLELTLILPYNGKDESFMTHPDPLVLTQDGLVDVPYSTYSVSVRDDEMGLIRTTTYTWHQAPIVSEEPINNNG